MMLTTYNSIIDIDRIKNEPYKIKSEDIALALSRKCRFNGNLKYFYTVAEHCMLVRDILKYEGYNEQTCNWGLLHYAHEAYISDIPSPIKKRLNDLKKLENVFDEAIEKRYKIDKKEVDIEAVELADKKAMLLEKNFFLTTDDWQYLKGVYTDYRPSFKSRDSSPKIVYKKFLKQLGGLFK